ncbi:MAG: MerC domain-containing protein [Psychroserpens sp.]|nr:MerC domain-containing protein [Psychroserpens sp.]
MTIHFGTKLQSDNVGALASTLCLIHCIATPFLFLAQTCSAACCSESPMWWSGIDFIFIGVSFFAVYWSAKTTSKGWIKKALWISWVALFVVILNEYIHLISLPEFVIYIPAIALVLLHLYNKKYCQCQDTSCCTS